jgi:hypothetical protein
MMHQSKYANWEITAKWGDDIGAINKKISWFEIMHIVCMGRIGRVG